MLLLSIDVGIRNLAYIIIKIDNLKHDIIEWKVIELCDKSVNASKVNNIDLGIVMNEKLNTICDKYKFDKILIENQIGKNAIKMKCIQNMLVMYYIIKGYKSDEIINYNASNKLKIFIKEKTTYAQRKKISKDITLKLCEKYNINFDTNINDIEKKTQIDNIFKSLTPINIQKLYNYIMF